MAEKKKQHYVPRFYLKLFSWGDKKAINIYNISNQKIILRGNLKNQCYEPYFYGKNPDVENAFKGLEDVASPIIKQIIGSNSAPERGTIEYYAIIHYVLLQLSRTKSAAETEDENIDTLTKFIVEKKRMVTREKLDQVKFRNINSASISLATMAQSIPIAMDLMCKVLVNKTNINFITSDNPVVLYNRACEQSQVFSHTGLASKGLKIIFPISPKHILLFYDEKIYKVGARRHCFADVIIDNDVWQFNDLQWLNALENIYFDNASLQPEILRGASKNIKKRNNKKVHIHIGDTQNEADGRQSALLYMYNPLDSSQNIQMN
ncbi:MAG: hypothetical protein QG641_1643, partial [Candidatus Poribacteria bacterium]|nr:hypothetical protein [Candidatus Poribacteria bacterium]